MKKMRSEAFILAFCLLIRGMNFVLFSKDQFLAAEKTRPLKLTGILARLNRNDNQISSKIILSKVNSINGDFNQKTRDRKTPEISDKEKEQHQEVENKNTNNSGQMDANSGVVEDIGPIILDQIPKLFDCNSEPELISCENQSHPHIKFRIKYLSKITSVTKDSNGSSENRIFHTVTLSNNARSEGELGNYHASYRFQVEQSTNNSNLKSQLQWAFGSDKAGFFRDLSNEVPLESTDIIADVTLRSITTLLFGREISLTKSKSSIYGNGPCNSDKTLFCTFNVYIVDEQYVKLFIQIGKYNAHYAIPRINFQAAILSYKNEIENFVMESKKNSQIENDFPISFPEFETEIKHQLDKLCTDCGKGNPLIEVPSSYHMCYKPFTKEVKISATKTSPATTAKLEFNLFAVYYSFGNLNYAEIVLDTERLQTELVIDLQKTSFGTELEKEAMLFVEDNDFNPQVGKHDSPVDFAMIQTRFQDFAEACKGGMVKPGSAGEFSVFCGELEVIKVYEVTNEVENSIKIDFLVIPQNSSKVANLGYVIQKINPYDQLDKIETAIKDYVESCSA